MKHFYLTTDIVSIVLDEITRAQKFIRIAMFQIHDDQVFDLLSAKLKQGVRVDILTLPFDSVNDDIRQHVTGLLKGLKSRGATVHYCRWNVGDPEGTRTAIGRWYSFHGKFLVTDLSAIALSANFTTQKELDAAIVITEEPQSIQEFSDKLDSLLEWFIDPHENSEGKIRDLILRTGIENAEELFELPSIIETTTHEKHWIRHYPTDLCPISSHPTDGLYIAPFDSRGRTFLEEVINSSEEFVYISAESFTDDLFPRLLKNTKQRGVDIQIITSPRSRDFTDRIQRIFRELLAYGVVIRKPDVDLHAKLLITEKNVVISSMNINRMNLGFNKTKAFWRENTETMYLCSDQSIINSAIDQFSNIFDSSIGIEFFLAEKIEGSVRVIFTSDFGLRTSGDVKTLFSKFILREEIKVKQLTVRIAKITAGITKRLGGRTVKKEHFCMGLIRYYLSERKHTSDQIEEKLVSLDPSISVSPLLSQLSNYGLIEKEGEYYKIALEEEH